MKLDKNGNPFENVSNIRITYKTQSNRVTKTNWSETDVLSFRAYKNAETDALHMGAELIIEDKETIIELIGALCKLCSTNNDL